MVRAAQAGVRPCNPVIVQIRRPGAPDGPPDDRDDSPNEPSEPLTLPRSYRVPTNVLAAKFAVAAAFGVAAIVVPGPTATVLAAVAGLATAGYASRDLVARERIRIEPDGIVVVHGFAGRGHLRWDQIERVRVDERLRLGVRTQLLEVDAGDWIGLYGRHELGAEPDAVAAAIDTARRP